MKKQLIILLFILLSNNSFSQQDLGLSFGVNRSNYIWTNLDEAGWLYKTGYFIGLRNTYFKNKKFELSTEVQYSNKGFTLGDGDNTTQNYKYLDGLHLLSYKPIEYVSFLGGFNTGFLLSNKEILLIDRDFDFGLVSGISLGGSKLNIFALYNYGLLNIETGTPGLEELGIRAFNSNLQVGLRYNFYNKTEKEKDPNPKTFEIGLSTMDLTNYRVLFKQKIDAKKYSRYDVSFANLEIDNLEADQKRVNAFFELGFGLEKRKYLKKIELLHGWMFRLGSRYTTKQFFAINPSIGYLIGLQYKYKTYWNIGIELTPQATLEIGHTRTKGYEVNSLFSFRNSPNIFVTYKLNN